jgi:predicted lipid-binding transport protein (Tim44 family)
LSGALIGSLATGLIGGLAGADVGVAGEAHALTTMATRTTTMSNFRVFIFLLHWQFFVGWLGQRRHRSIHPSGKSDISRQVEK